MSPARTSSLPTFTVVAPVFNELETLPEFVRRTGAVLTSLGEPWEIVLVDDGSTDGSTQLIEDLARRDRRLRPVIFSRNFGHQIAATAGLDHARGQAAIIIDVDLQDPPELLPELLTGIKRISRRAMSAPSSGSSKVHAVEQQEIIDEAFR